MSSEREDLAVEIKRLREELNQMREIVNMLLNVMMEESDEDEEYGSAVVRNDDQANRFNLCN